MKFLGHLKIKHKVREQLQEARNEMHKSIDDYCGGKSTEPTVVNVLYIDDEQQNLVSFKSIFRKDFCVFTANNCEEAEAIIEKENIHVVLCDQKMPKIEGIDFLIKTSTKYPAVTRILITAFTTTELVLKAVNDAKVFKVIDKPFDEMLLKSSIQEGHREHLKLMLD